MPPLQDALWGNPAPMQTPTPTRRRRPAPIPEGQVRWATTSARRDCQACWQEQDQAVRTGRQPEHRRAARILRTTAGGREYLCESHARAAGWPGRASTGRAAR